MEISYEDDDEAIQSAPYTCVRMAFTCKWVPLAPTSLKQLWGHTSLCTHLLAWDCVWNTIWNIGFHVGVTTVHTLLCRTVHTTQMHIRYFSKNLYQFYRRLNLKNVTVLLLQCIWSMVNKHNRRHWPLLSLLPSLGQIWFKGMCSDMYWHLSDSILN
jgi:hypothetical protein